MPFWVGLDTTSAYSPDASKDPCVFLRIGESIIDRSEPRRLPFQAIASHALHRDSGLSAVTVGLLHVVSCRASRYESFLHVVLTFGSAGISSQLPARHFQHVTVQHVNRCIVQSRSRTRANMGFTFLAFSFVCLFVLSFLFLIFNRPLETHLRTQHLTCLVGSIGLSPKRSLLLPIFGKAIITDSYFHSAGFR